MPITKDNHYNPCFWTAYWNSEYYFKKKNDPNFKGKAREQVIFSLNLKSNKILSTKVDNVFYEKGSGIARITKKEMLDYCKRNVPSEYQDVSDYYEKNPQDTFIDFENHFTGIENVIRDVLESIIKTRNIKDISDKTYLSFIIFFQILRNHNTLKEFENYFDSKSLPKFELFINLKNTLSSNEAIWGLILPILSSKWTLYRLKRNRLPLSDNPVLIRPLHIFMALAPDLLIEIDLKKKVSVDNICKISNNLSLLKLREFKKRTITNSSREIIFGDSRLLEKWQKSSAYKKHRKYLNGTKR